MGLLLTCKHYTSLKTTCQSRQLLYIRGEIETRGKNKKKQAWGRRVKHTKKIPSVFPKRNTIFCCNVLVYINCLHWLSAKTICLEELSNGYIREEHYLEFIAFACPKIIKVIQKIGPMSEICHHCNTQT